MKKTYIYNFCHWLLLFVLLLMFVSTVCVICIVLPVVEQYKGRLNCQHDWMNFKQRCYLPIFENLNLMEAKEACVNVNGSLASIHTSAENEQVMSLMKFETGWLNGRLIDGLWVWIDKSQWDFQQWAPGEPQDERPCIKITAAGWISAKCSDREPAFMCIADEEITVQPEIRPETHPETYSCWFFFILPGLCLALLPAAMICFRLPPDENENTPLAKIIKSLLLCLFCIFGPSLNFFTHLDKTKCLFCLFPNLFNWCKCPCKFRICPLHNDLIWFIGSTPKRKKIYFQSTGLFFGSVLSFCVHGYIVMQTASMKSINAFNWITMILTILGLASMSYTLFSFKDDNEEGLFSRIFSKIRFLFCKEKENIQENIKIKQLRPLPEIHENERSFALPTTLQSASTDQGDDLTEKEIEDKGCIQFLKTYVFPYTFFPFPLFLANGLYNISTLVLLINLNPWLSIFMPIIWLPIGFFTCFILGCIDTRDKIDLRYRFPMVWSSLFVFAVPLWQHAEGTIERPEEIKRTVVWTAAWLQIVHNFLNIGALVVCMFLRPEDYVFIPGKMIWLYLVIGNCSLVSMVAWLLWLLLHVHVKKQSSNLLEENTGGCSLTTDAVPQNPQTPDRDGFLDQESNFETEESAGAMSRRAFELRKDLKIKQH